MNSSVDISIAGLLSAYLLGFFTLVFLSVQRNSLWKNYGFALGRMTLQLIVVGYVLDYIFTARSPVFLGIMVIVMVVSTTQIVISQNKIPYGDYFFTMLFLFLGIVSVASIFFFVFVIAHPQAWAYFPQYIIPISGMLLGNSMNSTVVALKSLLRISQEQRSQIEQKLALGATIKQALAPYLKEALSLAILPGISSMAGMGLVSLPGMMTGQILAGVSPLLAIKYQLAIMLAISTVSVFSSYLLLRLAYPKIYRGDWRLNEKTIIRK
jgi:putative ABC transport system permease protein